MAHIDENHEAVAHICMIINNDTQARKNEQEECKYRQQEEDNNTAEPVPDSASCYEHGLSTAKYAKPWTHMDPQVTSPHVIKPRPKRHSYSRRPGVMAHHRMTSLLPFLHRSAMRFPSFLSDHQEDFHRTLQGIPREFPSLLPGKPQRFPQGDGS